jgi:uncharacterized coiled-coil protein SlyX
MLKELKNDILKIEHFLEKFQDKSFEFLNEIETEIENIIKQIDDKIKLLKNEILD